MSEQDVNEPYAPPESALLVESAARAEYVGFWIRAVAYLVDSVICILLFVALAIPTVGLEHFNTDGSYNFEVPWWFIVGYLAGFWIWKSSSPGKLLFTATIVDAETFEKPRIWQYLVRVLGYVVSLVPLGLGFFWIAFHGEKRGWHDLLARTVVVRDWKI